jgi:hypothetical protein
MSSTKTVLLLRVATGSDVLGTMRLDAMCDQTGTGRALERLLPLGRP